MTTGLVATSGALLLVGVFLLVMGLVRRERLVEDRSTVSSTGLWTKLRDRWHRLSRAQKLRLGVAVAAGFMVFAVTGWLLMIFVVPLAIVGLPVLLAAPHNRDLELLEALDRWVRALSSSLPTGKSVADAIRSTRQQVPATLAESVTLAVARMDGRWTTSDALRAMADDLDSPDADAVLAALMLAADRGGIGATETLHALSDSIHERLKALREIETERAKPRIVVRQVTVITVAMLAIGLVLGSGFFTPYRTPLGQIVLAVLLAAYTGSLVMLRHRTVPRRRDRILVGGGHD